MLTDLEVRNDRTPRSNGELRVDVVVVGAGPAGSVAAARLAAAGLDVVLVDRRRPPVTPVQTLTADAYRLLVELTGAALISDSVHQVESMCVRWGSSSANEAPVAVEQLIVERFGFDASLHAWAVRSGVRVVFGWATEIAERHTRIETPTGVLTVTSRASILATGRSDALGARRDSTAPRTLALHGAVSGNSAAAMCIEALAHSWLWSVNHGGRLHVVATTAVIPKSMQRTAMQGLLDHSTLLFDCVVDGPIEALDVTPSINVRSAVERLHVIGDAALFLDPLSGHGLSAAIRSAVQLTDSLLADGVDTPHVRVVRDPAGLAAHHVALGLAYYREAAGRFATPFWCERATPHLGRRV